MTQRYNCIGRDWDMEPDDQGDWVRYSDLAKARAEIERLTVEREPAAQHRQRGIEWIARSKPDQIFCRTWLGLRCCSNSGLSLPS